MMRIKVCGARYTNFLDANSAFRYCVARKMEASSVEFFTFTGTAVLSVSIYGIIDKVLICGYMYLS